MLDTWAIESSNGTGYDGTSEVETWTEQFTVPGRLKVIGAYATPMEVGGRTAMETVRELHIPVDAPTIPSGRTCARLTTRGSLTDPSLEVGTRLILEGPAPGSQTTARRLKVTEVVS